ncbi:MAG: hypothetical protein ACJ768_00030 [Gaiellaceae bacterium]
MHIVNNTNQDYWFGPLHLPASGTLDVDDTSSTSLYLTNDQVADAINNLWAATKIGVTLQAQPFPRPTGVPQLLHGDGSPEGLVYASQGSLYMRRDAGNADGLYLKTSGITISTGWQAYTVASAVSGLVQLYDSGYISAAQATFDTGAAGFSTSFTHLLVKLIGRGDTASNNVQSKMTFNGDTGANYSQVDVSASSTTTTAEEYSGTSPSTTPQTSIFHPIPAASSLAAWFGLNQIVLPFYTGTFIKPYTIQKLGGPNLYAASGGGYWNSTTAINRIQIALATGNFAAGSRLMVYAYN